MRSYESILRQLEEGLCFGEEVTLIPFWGHRKVKKLLRTQIDIFSEGHVKLEGDHFSWVLPAQKDISFHYQLQLISVVKNKQETGKYLLKSFCDRPFKLNGSFCYEAFLQRGDRVQIDCNFLYFQGAQLKGKSEILNSKLVESPLNILLEGETGTGKSYLAHEVHRRCQRKGRFIHVNLAAYSPQLVESEIFGHVKGAFTGADNDRVGAISSANHGTLFLDEVDSLPVEIQTKLLLFLDSKKFCPVGGDREVMVNTRLIFASGKDLTQEVRCGRMRKDFFFRISSAHVLKLSPLREDIEKLEELQQKFELEHNVVFSKRVSDFYKTLPWPGNIRQFLEHLEKKCVLAVKRRIDFDQEDELLLKQSSGLEEIDEFCAEKGVMKLRELRELYALRTYYSLGESVGRTSKLLGMNSRTLEKLLKQVA